MLILRPRLEACPGEVLVAVPEHLPLLDVAVAVVIPLAAAVPQLITVPDGPHVEVAEIGPVPEQRLRRRGVTGQRIDLLPGGVGAIHVAGPRVLRARQPD